MRRGARSAATLAVLSAILVIGGAWGWSEVTKPFPGKADPPVCVDTAVSAGEKVYPGQRQRQAEHDQRHQRAEPGVHQPATVCTRACRTDRCWRAARSARCRPSSR